MANISKSLASDIAKDMVQHLNPKIKEAQKQLTDFFEEIYLKTIPQDVISVWKKYPDYIKTSGTFTLFGNGFNHESISLPNFLPDLGLYKFDPQKDGKKLRELYDNHKKLISQQKTLAKKIEVTLLGLKTYKRVSENFPEAVPFLPTSPNTQVAVCCEDVRAALKESL